MYNHYTVVKDLLDGEEPLPVGASDMEIIVSQASLMKEGANIFLAMKSGEIAQILAGLVALAHSALQAIAKHQAKMPETEGQPYPEYHMLGIMRMLTESIHACASGEVEHYAALYYRCASLVSGFINADFNKAFLVYHEWYKTQGGLREHFEPDWPDLTDCLYE